MKKIASCIVFTITCGLCLYGQQPTEEMEMQLESIAEGSEDSEVDLLQWAEELAILKENPLAVNFADLGELKQIPFLNIFQIANLIQYREETGTIYSPYELAAIPGWDKELARQAMEYLNFNPERKQPKIEFDKMARYSRHRVLARSTRTFPLRRGFRQDEENGFLGAPQDYYLRYRGQYRDMISVGFIMQQDKGEPFGSSFSSFPIDHVSGHLALKNYGNIKSLIIGDYQAEFGQGLALWSSLAFGKSADATSIKRYARKFKPFNGAEENRFFRGAATTYRFRQKWDISAFYSRNAIDANVSEEDTTGQPAFVSSLQTTGLHRTSNELENKNANRLQTMGANLKYVGSGFSVGATVINYQLETPLERGNQIYKQFDFAGTELSNYSVDFNYLFGRVSLFGESALSDNGAMAHTVGLESNPAESFYLTLAYRHLDKKYQALFNAPFAESGKNGERGTYLGLRWDVAGRVSLKAYADAYEFSWARFRVDQPSRGQDYFTQVEVDFSRSFTGYVRFKHENRQVNGQATAADRIPNLIDNKRSTIRLHTKYRLNKNWRLSSRLEWALQEEAGASETGQVIFQDVRYTLPRWPLQLTARYAIINTDSYDTRIYAYENDVLYSFSIPPYFGRANRFYIVADWDIMPKLSLQAKYARTVFLDRETISSGQNEIDGNSITDIKVQLRWKF